MSKNKFKLSWQNSLCLLQSTVMSCLMSINQGHYLRLRLFPICLEEADMTALAHTIICINDKIRQLNLEIQKAHNEDDGASNYVLVCLLVVVGFSTIVWYA